MKLTFICFLKIPFVWFVCLFGFTKKRKGNINYVLLIKKQENETNYLNLFRFSLYKVLIKSILKKEKGTFNMFFVNKKKKTNKQNFHSFVC